LDEDEDGYDDEYKKYIKDTLKPYMKSIVIYSNKTFHKSSFENKYKQVIENEIKLCNKTWNDVNKIIKIEDRYER
jgi:chromosomal replication initiation ATPase DnaA